MRCGILVIFLCLTSALLLEQVKADSGNPQIDYQQFAAHVETVGKLREKRRISESEFLKMSQDPDAVILDARSRQKYDLLHLKDARHLSLPDMTEAELAKVIPTKNTRVLIYCNNNFANEPEAFPIKRASASLNLHTFNVLYSYGYTNVYELKPFLDINETKLPLVGDQMQRKGKGARAK